ncbi:Fruiting body protein SC7 [Grifola frondosa]|uniref:Fruiting body protein SC7 n=1 Tax=Grifola frondosa TaxID=5627 RepID=A0A1C7MR70_GRIFR|nr:Fruiting body protein SC7 [Grifola frondosa]
MTASFALVRVVSISFHSSAHARAASFLFNMTHLAFLLLSLCVLLSLAPSGFAGPACARRSQAQDNCVEKCKDKWGWPGRIMGSDPWGQVMTTSTIDIAAAVTKACRVRTTTSSSASTSSVTEVTSATVSSASTSVVHTTSLSSSLTAIPANVAPSVNLSSLSTSTPTQSQSSSATTSHVPTTSSTSSSSSSSQTPKPAATLSSSSSTTSSTPATTHSSTSTPPPAPSTTSSTPQPTPTHTTTASSASKASFSSSSSSSSPSAAAAASVGDATSQSDIDQYLSAHNTVRAQHGASALTWGDNLASKAQQWANGCVFQHSGGSLGPFGGRVKASTQVGCAVQLCNGIFDPSFGEAKYFVCEYSPQGNVIGEFPQHQSVYTFDGACMVSRGSTLSEISYVILVLLTTFFVALSCALILSQAVRTAPNREWVENFNTVVIGGAYTIVFVLSLGFCLKRRIAVHRRLQRISKEFHTLGKADVPDSVYWYVQQEYSRACLVTYEALPKDGFQEGWGKPGTKYEGIRFRTALLDSIRDIDKLAHLVIPRHPALRPHARMLHHFRFILPLLSRDEVGLTPLHYYDSAIQLSRHGSREPTEGEYIIGMRAAKGIERTLDECHMEMREGSSTDLSEYVVTTPSFDTGAMGYLKS